MSRWSTGTVAVVVALSVAACSHGKPSATPSSSSSSPSSAAPSPSSPRTSAQSGPSSSAAAGSPATSAAPANGCPNVDGGACRGTLPAGTYHTIEFSPQISYTLPKGWGELEDTPGNFLLIPPGGALAGVDPGTSDYVGVYSGIAAGSSDCATSGAAPEVGTTPAKIAAHWANLSTVTATKPRTVTVGGLHGLVLDLTPNLSAKACKEPTSAYGYQSLLVGVGPASLDHGLIKGLHLRVYLLTEPDDSTLAIEIDDVHGGGGLAAYSKVAEALKFGK
jgi:hypothetical protein